MHDVLLGALYALPVLAVGCLVAAIVLSVRWRVKHRKAGTGSRALRVAIATVWVVAVLATVFWLLGLGYFQAFPTGYSLVVAAFGRG